MKISRFAPVLLLAPFLSACSQTGTGNPLPLAQNPASQESGVPTASGLRVPKGFDVQLWAQGLEGPRRLAIAPGGNAKRFEVFVSESAANRVSIFESTNGKAGPKTVFARDLSQPYGIEFWKDWVYIANTDAVVRLPRKDGTARPEKITTLTQGGYNQHWTRNLQFSRDKKQLFVTVGSSCNTCEEDDPQRAAISVMNPDGSGKKLFATGLRNPVGLALQPGSGALWTVVNERDNMGDNVPPDYLTRVEKGGFYGWPYAYTTIEGKVESDPTFGEKSPGKVASTIAPDVPVQAHSAALGVAFYPLKGGNFPADFRGDAFLTFHGSWNHSEKTGYKVVRVNFENGKPRGVSDFVTGYLKADKSVWGRPVDIVAAPDGSLLFSDDGGGKIWRVFRK